MARPKANSFILAPLLLPLLAGADPIEWTTPRQLAPDAAAFIRQAYHSTDARDTALWTLWFEDRGTEQNLLKASRFSNESWLEPELVTSDTTWGDIVGTAVDANLNPWAAWRNSWSRRQGDSWTTPQLINQDTAGWGGPRVTSDPVQGIWAIWGRLEPARDSVSILSSYCASDSWTPPSLVARFLYWFIPYVPVITAPPGRKVRSVWTGALSSGIGIYSATWSGDSWEDHELIPESWLGYWPSVCSDSVGGTWVTWYSGWDDDGAVLCARHDGTAWTDTWCLATGNAVVHQGMLCCDERGRIWAMWMDSSICVRYFDGDSWSDRCEVAACAGTHGCARIAAALGRVWATWTERESDDRWLLYYSHTLPAGVAGHEQQRLAEVKVTPSLVRAGAGFRLFGLLPGQTVQLLDAAGREVGARFMRPRDLCTSSLQSGVYFVRISGSGEPVTRKVLVIRED